jgi:hypothetical protein
MAEDIKQNPIDIIKNTFKKGINLADKYQLPEVQTAIYNLPEPLRSIANIVLSAFGQYVFEIRLSETLISLYEEIESIGERKIDMSFLHTEHFKDLVIKAVENSVRTRFKERIKLNCRILAGTISIDSINNRGSSDEFLDSVAELNPKDLQIAQIIYQQQKDRLPKFDIESEDNTELKYIVRKGWHDIPNLCHVTEQQFNISLFKLSKAGLIKEIIGTYSNYTGGLYLITPLFQDLMRFLKEELIGAPIKPL